MKKFTDEYYSDLLGDDDFEEETLSRSISRKLAGLEEEIDLDQLEVYKYY